MEVKATYKFARISPLKARDVAREVTGLPVSDALDVIRFTPKKAAFLIGKTLKSAVANAENNHDLSSDDLVVKSATVTEGPVFKRWKPRARGGAAPIKKRTAHINVILSDELGDIAVPGKDKSKGGAKSQKTEESKPVAKKKTAAKKDSGAQTIQDSKLGAIYESEPDQVDDLKQIGGVGPKIEQKLNEAGVYTFEQGRELGQRSNGSFWRAPQFPGSDPERRLAGPG